MDIREKQLLTVKEVALLLGLSEPTIWRQTRKGNIPKPIQIGGATRWRKSDIEAIYASEAA